MDTAGILLEFAACTGVAGMEQEAAQYAARLLEPYGETELTPLGSLICRVREPGPGEPHLLLDAHMDEIGMIVTCMEDSGFLRVSNCGGIDRRLLMAQQVTVHTANGSLPGVICSTPPHLSDASDSKNKKVDEIYIDIGYSGEEAKEKVQPGDRITIDSAFRPLLDGLVTGKSLDDRAGCVSLLCALEYLNLKKLNCGLSVVFSSMEEVGGQGAKTAAWILEPTHAIAVDVSYAWTPDAAREKCGDLKKGPMIGFAPILNREMSAQLVTLAEQENIPYQYEIMSGKTGTNADQIATTRAGVVCGLLSIPQKYMHTPIETVAVSDVENTGRLIAAYINTMGGAAQ